MISAPITHKISHRDDIRARHNVRNEVRDNDAVGICDEKASDEIVSA